MKDEYISLSIAGVCGLFFAGAILGAMLMSRADAGSIILFIMLLVLVRRDAREKEPSGTYQRGWFVWRRTGPCKSKTDLSVSA